MNILKNLQQSGYTAQQALNILSRTYPQLSSKIKQAASSGYSPKEIFSFLGMAGFNKLSKFKGSKNEKSEDPYPEGNPYIAADKAFRKNQEMPEGVKTAGKVALGTAAAASLPYLAPQLASSIAGSAIGRALPAAARALPTAARNAINPIVQAVSKTVNPMAQTIPKAASTGVQAGAKAAQAAQAAAAPAAQTVNAGKIFDMLGISKQVQNIAASVNPEDTASVIEQHLLKPGQRKWLKENVKEPLSSLVSRFMSESTSQETPENEPSAQMPEEEIEQPQPQQTQEISQTPLPQLPNPIENSFQDSTNSLVENQEDLKENKKVRLPNGHIGEIQSVKNGIATIDVNGEIKHRKLDELERSPIPDRDLADIYEELTNSIPEHARSAVINWAGYDPNVNELAFRPHSGALYVYKNIPEDFVEKLKNAMFSAKTTGENFYGAWKEGESSRFSGLGGLIRELQKQYGGKGKEYVRKYETVHDFLDLPEKAKREKKRKENEKRKREKARK